MELGTKLIYNNNDDNHKNSKKLAPVSSLTIASDLLIKQSRTKHINFVRLCYLFFVFILFLYLSVRKCWQLRNQSVSF